MGEKAVRLPFTVEHVSSEARFSVGRVNSNPFPVFRLTRPSPKSTGPRLSRPRAHGIFREHQGLAVCEVRQEKVSIPVCFEPGCTSADTDRPPVRAWHTADSAATRRRSLCASTAFTGSIKSSSCPMSTRRARPPERRRTTRAHHASAVPQAPPLAPVLMQISTKIEVYTGRPAPGTSEVVLSRLGHLSFDRSAPAGNSQPSHLPLRSLRACIARSVGSLSPRCQSLGWTASPTKPTPAAASPAPLRHSNEATKFQARELKSVHVSVTASALKLVLHKCHLNRLNIYNQARAPRNTREYPIPCPVEPPPGEERFVRLNDC